MLWVKLVHLCSIAGLFTAGMLWVAGLVLSYVFRDHESIAADTHYTMQIRTFWVSILVAVIAVPLCLLIVGFPILFMLWVWQLVRSVRGLRFAIENKPYPNPLGLGFT